MPLAGRATRWLGARRAVWGLIALFAGCLVLPVLAPSLPLLWLALLLFGGAGGIADVRPVRIYPLMTFGKIVFVVGHGATVSYQQMGLKYTRTVGIDRSRLHEELS